MSDRFESLESGEVVSIQHETQVLSGHRTFRAKTKMTGLPIELSIVKPSDLAPRDGKRGGLGYR
jgi:hypothetical protein